MKLRSTPRPNLVPTTLARESQWIARSLRMMVEAASRSDAARKTGDRWLADAGAEVFVLNARLLFEFLWGTKGSEWRPDTVASVDFCQPKPPEPSLPSGKLWREEWLKPAHKLLAHLSIDRDLVKAAVGGWPADEIIRAAVTGLEFVLVRAPATSVDPALHQAVGDARALYP